MLCNQNAISLRLEKLYHCWDKETSGKDSKLFRWVVKSDEKTMVECFYSLEASENGATDDIFLKFCTPFESGHTYSQNLSEEFRSLWETEKKEFVDDVEDFSWNFRSGMDSGDRDIFFRNIARFARIIGKNQRIIIYLAPTEIKREQEYDLWLINAVKLQLPLNCCLMIIAEQDDEPDKKTGTPSGKECVILRPNLNMKEAFAQIAGFGIETDLNAVFRRRFVQIAEAIDIRNYLCAQNLGRDLLDCIEDDEWASVRISVWILMANACMGSLKYTKAISYYKAGALEAEKIQKSNPELGKRLRVICMIGSGNCYVLKKQYNLASQLYRQAGAFGIEASDFLIAMESHRMAGFCYQKMGIRQLAIESYRNAFDAGQQLDVKLQQCVTFLMVGRQLSSITNKAEEKIATRKKMVELIGSDWELKYQQLKQA